MVEIGANLTTVLLAVVSLIASIVSLIRAELSVRSTGEVKAAVDTNSVRITKLENGK